jgi:hypothetical protein
MMERPVWGLEEVVCCHCYWSAGDGCLGSLEVGVRKNCEVENRSDRYKQVKSARHKSANHKTKFRIIKVNGYLKDQG